MLSVFGIKCLDTGLPALFLSVMKHKGWRIFSQRTTDYVLKIYKTQVIDKAMTRRGKDLDSSTRHR